jgi:uncharacterized protein (DUF433 family)/plasmid maintenance system antidote protein VapI
MRPRFKVTCHGSVKRQIINTLEIPNYTLDETARYLHVPASTIHYWVIGERGIAPLTTIYSRSPQILLCFKNLVELFVLESLRNTHGISLQAIRVSVEELRHRRSSKYPLADYQLSTRGARTVYLDDDGEQLVSLTESGQQAFREILHPFLKRVQRNEKGIANRLFPFTQKRHLSAPSEAPRFVVIDPSVAFGKPVLVNSRISTAFLFSRHRGGTSISKLATDYGRPEAEIEEAIQLESQAA